MINCIRATSGNIFKQRTSNRWQKCSNFNPQSRVRAARVPTITELEKATDKEYYRKPYMSGPWGGLYGAGKVNSEIDYYDMMTRPTDRAVWDENEERYQEFETQSEFKKPYLGEEYPEMEHFYPDPNLKFYRPSGTSKIRYGKGHYGQSDCGPCHIFCTGETGSSCKDKEPVGKCHVSVACFKEVQVLTDGPLQYKWSVSGPYREIDYFKKAIGTEKLRTGGSGGNGAAITIYPDWDNIVSVNDKKKANFNVQLRDGLGNVCSQKVTVTCSEPCCPAETVFAYDANNPETIARSAGAEILVTGGCGPFTWAVSGTGFSFTSATTDVRSNTLNADATACGTATLTITDDCGTVLTEYVRCTTGQWVDTGNNACTVTGVGTQITGSFPTCSPCEYEIISGNKKVVATIYGPRSGDDYCRDYLESCEAGDAYECASSGQDNCEACGASPVDMCTCYEDYAGSSDYCWCSGGKTDYTWVC